MFPSESTMRQILLDLCRELCVELKMRSSMINGVSVSGQSDGGPRRSVVGTLIMLPIGLIIVLVVVLYFVVFGNGYVPGYFPGEFLLIFVVLFLGLFVIRTLYWRSRRNHWREQYRRSAPIHILRQRYARGEVTKEQYDQMLRDLAQKS